MSAGSHNDIRRRGVAVEKLLLPHSAIINVLFFALFCFILANDKHQKQGVLFIILPPRCQIFTYWGIEPDVSVFPSGAPPW